MKKFYTITFLMTSLFCQVMPTSQSEKATPQIKKQKTSALRKMLRPSTIISGIALTISGISLFLLRQTNNKLAAAQKDSSSPHVNLTELPQDMENKINTTLASLKAQHQNDLVRLEERLRETLQRKDPSTPAVERLQPSQPQAAEAVKQTIADQDRLRESIYKATEERLKTALNDHIVRHLQALQDAEAQVEKSLKTMADDKVALSVNDFTQMAGGVKALQEALADFKEFKMIFDPKTSSCTDNARKATDADCRVAQVVDACNNFKKELIQRSQELIASMQQTYDKQTQGMQTILQKQEALVKLAEEMKKKCNDTASFQRRFIELNKDVAALKQSKATPAQ